MNKLSEENLKEVIVKEEYVKVGVKTTVCCLTLKNGFEVIGQSACVDPANFNEELGKQLAYKNAFEKIWELEGYKLQYDLMKNT